MNHVELSSASYLLKLQLSLAREDFSPYVCQHASTFFITFLSARPHGALSFLINLASYRKSKLSKNSVKATCWNYFTFFSIFFIVIEAGKD